MSRLQMIGAATTAAAPGGDGGGTDPAWRNNYDPDWMPLAADFVDSITVSEGESIGAAVDAMHGLAGLGLVLVEPGTYDEHLFGHADVGIFGTTGDPLDVMVSVDGSTTAGLWSAINGSPGFLGGMTFQLRTSTGGGSGQYAFHESSGGLSIKEKCIFESLDLARNAAVGSDVGAGTRSFYFDCFFYEANAGRLGMNDFHSMNMHGTGAGDPTIICFVECYATGMVGYGDAGSGNFDEFWYTNSDAPSYDGSGGGVNTVYYLDPTRVGGSAGGPGVTVVRTTDLPDLPFHGVL